MEGYVEHAMAGPSRATAGPRETFSRAPLGRKCFSFPFLSGTF